MVPTGAVTLHYSLAPSTYPLPFGATNSVDVFDTGEMVDVSIYAMVVSNGLIDNVATYSMLEEEVDAQVSGDFIKQFGGKLGHNPSPIPRPLLNAVDKIGMLFVKSLGMRNGHAKWLIPTHLYKEDGDYMKTININQRYELKDGILSISKGEQLLATIDMNSYQDPPQTECKCKCQ